MMLSLLYYRYLHACSFCRHSWWYYARWLSAGAWYTFLLAAGRAAGSRCSWWCHWWPLLQKATDAIVVENIYFEAFWGLYYWVAAFSLYLKGRCRAVTSSSIAHALLVFPFILFYRRAAVSFHWYRYAPDFRQRCFQVFQAWWHARVITISLFFWFELLLMLN